MGDTVIIDEPDSKPDTVVVVKPPPKVEKVVTEKTTVIETRKED